MIWWECRAETGSCFIYRVDFWLWIRREPVDADSSGFLFRCESASPRLGAFHNLRILAGVVGCDMVIEVEGQVGWGYFAVD